MHSDAEPASADVKTDSTEGKSGPGQSGSGLAAFVSPAWLTDVLTTLAAFIMFLGPGVTTSFYLVMVGYYEAKFDTKLFFIVMLLAIYGPFPVVTAMQASFDAYFDRALSTRSTYSTRIGLGLIMLQALTVLWMFMPAREASVICIGFALGACGAVVQASGHQIISTINPKKLIFAELGGQIGSVVPIIMISILDFQPSASPWEFRRIISTVVVVNFTSMVVLATLHFVAFFDNAFARLALDLDVEGDEAEDAAFARQVSKEANSTKLLDEPMEASYQAASRQATPVMVSTPSSRRNIPVWVFHWQFVKGAMTVVMAFIVSLAGFYGNPAYTQFLASIKLASDFLGRLSSFPLVKCESFGETPWHRLLAATVATRLVLFALMLVQLGHPILPKPLFCFVWCLFAVLDRNMATFSDVTCGAFVEVKDRKYVSRLTFFCGFGGLILGLGFAAAVAVPMVSHAAADESKLVQQDSAWNVGSVRPYHPAATVDFHAARAGAAHFVLGPG